MKDAGTEIRRRPGRAVALLVLVLLAAPALAVRYQAPLDASHWQVGASLFACRMSHEIPLYGVAVFEQVAGERLAFHLLPETPRLAPGQASLVSRAPRWRPGSEAVPLGEVTVEEGERPVRLARQRSEQLLAELAAGRELEFARAPWYGARDRSRVVLSSVNFQPAYRRYLGCLGDLLPVNFEQIRRTALYFPGGSDALGVKQLRHLDHIARYVAADPRVDAFFVDGHTDANGSREDNLELSRLRAEQVVGLLRERGIDPERITVRWHGERYPVASNRSAEGRSRNRRVTIRLERSGERPLPDLAGSPPN